MKYLRCHIGAGGPVKETEIRSMCALTAAHVGVWISN